MLGGGFLNSRLATRIRQKEGISYGVGTSLQASAFDKYASFMTYAIYAPANQARLMAAFKEEMERALKDGFTDDELKSAKTGLLQAREVQRSQDGSLAQLLATSLYAERTLSFDAELEKKLTGLDNKSIVAALNKHLNPAGLSLFRAGDFTKSENRAQR
jgi:zinc protease